MNRLIWSLFLFISLLLNVAGCSAYSDMNGSVIDAETGKPIEGAVVLVEWTKTKGIGLTHTESFKVVEVFTDKDGKFAVSGVSDPFVNAPDLTVYKKGYVCWNNKNIFPDYKQRSDFKWSYSYTVRIIKFNDKYSYNDHVSFIRGSTRISLNHKAKTTMYHAFDWEDNLAQKERLIKGLSP